MKETITLQTFIRGFEELRPNNFSYQGLEILFNHLESMESDENEIEYDVIAFCCDYSEMSIAEIMDQYDIQIPVDIMLSTDETTCKYSESDLDDTEKLEYIFEHLEENGNGYCGVTSENTIIFQCY
tara:strand:+ start:1948 stop:2325 length:378 start_codon:yes stop_codon:yes gene_type:complete